MRLAVLLAVALSACTGNRVVTERRPDGIFHLKCKMSLQQCLDQAEILCNHQRFAVLRAFDDHGWKGVSLYTLETRDSEAYVRCTQTASWGPENTDLMKAPLCPEAEAPKSPAPAPAAPARACTPGATQACVGPAGCKGGQACTPDGAAYGPCDCGPAPAP